MHWIRSDKTYRKMLEATSVEARTAIFETELVDPLGALLDFGRKWNPQARTRTDIARGMLWLMPEDLVQPPDGLIMLEQAGAWERAEEALTEAVERFRPFQDRVEVETEVVGTILLTRTSPASQYGGGYAGAQTSGIVVVTYHEPTPKNVGKAAGVVVHEFNHRVRLSAFPWTDPNNVEVAEYVVMEGLAEAFAVQVCGLESLGFHVTSVDEAEVERAATIIARNRYERGFDRIRAHVFGDEIANQMGFDSQLGMPTFGGYAVGYHIVQAYIQRSGNTIEEASLVPAHEIIEESGYLE